MICVVAFSFDCVAWEESGSVFFYDQPFVRSGRQELNSNFRLLSPDLLDFFSYFHAPGYGFSPWYSLRFVDVFLKWNKGQKEYSKCTLKKARRIITKTIFILCYDT